MELFREWTESGVCGKWISKTDKVHTSLVRQGFPLVFTCHTKDILGVPSVEVVVGGRSPCPPRYPGPRIRIE